MTHKTIPPDIRRAAGVSDSLIRLSVGLEEAEDLIADLRNTFDRIVVRSNKLFETFRKLLNYHMDAHKQLRIGLIWIWCRGRRSLPHFTTNTFPESKY